MRWQEMDAFARYGVGRWVGDEAGERCSSS